MLRDIFGICVITFLVIAAIFTFIGAIVLPISQLDSRSFVKQFKQTEETVAVVRAKGEMPEADMLIQANQILADKKYYNSLFILGWGITDQVDDLKPIE